LKQPEVNDFTQPIDITLGITLIAVFGLNGVVAYDLFTGSLTTNKYLAFL
jgi:hypothetical protein